MSAPVRVAWRRGDGGPELLTREWLVTNGLGGYASGTVGGTASRRFHGVLVAALPAPRGRMMLLNDLTEEATIGDSCFDLGRAETLAELRMENGLPVWESEHRGTVIEKRVVLPHRQNTVFVTYRVVRSAGPVVLRLRPWLHMRPHEGILADGKTAPYPVRMLGNVCDIEGPHDLTLRTTIADAPSRLVLDGGRTRTVGFEVERDRGYDFEEALWSPGFHELTLEVGAEASFVASVESWDRVEALSPREALISENERRLRLLSLATENLRKGFGAELVLGADQFVITPQTRVADTARARAVGVEASTVIAGYHWFTDWGRDTMISLEGLTLVTGRHAEAESILRMFAHYVKDGLLPNMFPEGESEGLYHTADASMWFFHAVQRYLDHTGDKEIIHHLLPTLESIIGKHLTGTHFGIGVDPADGLLRQGAEGYQLTWMDAKVGDWVVTPRRGKAVEINALFYNALCLLRGWLQTVGRNDDAAVIQGHAERARASFNARFWMEKESRLFDVIDGPNGDDPALRPNQLFAISLDHPVLDKQRWAGVMTAVTQKLLTPVGLRTLSPDHPDYKARYDGDLRSRDAAYHQGTVWAWLMGPFVDAFERTYPTEVDRRDRLLEGFATHLGEACLGSISEIFDATAPYLPRGCVAQAWSVAEALRILSRTSK